MLFANLFDATSAVIVVGGTCLSTVLRCGLRDSGATLTALGAIGRPGFDAAKAKAELASHVRAMRKDGVIRTEPRRYGDAELEEATDGLISNRSASALHAAHTAHKRRRKQASLRAMRTLNQAADLAPVFGLAGTLVSLSQLPGGGSGGNFTAAISMAVLTTLYGLLLGNIVFAPLARIVARRAAQEETARQDVLDWLDRQVAEALPVPANGRGDAAVPLRKRSAGAGHLR